METQSVRVAERIQRALAENRPVVALESTIISHGLPYPENLTAAKEFEQILIDAGVEPATIAVIDGIPTVGLEADQVELLARGDMAKASVRDLGILRAKGLSGATTVAATAFIAAKTGISVFATGGLGGVHRDFSETFDESADLSELAKVSIVVVAAGVKSVLDIAATLERLETLSVQVAGYKTKDFPSFWLPTSGHELDWSVDSPAEAAQALLAARQSGLVSALLLANPVPKEQAWEKIEHDRVLTKALQSAKDSGVRGKAVTPFLLEYIVKESGGRSLQVNLDLVRNNIRVASEVAKEIVRANT
jgi:pseudouridine-5'-phosphate glycosidase